MSVTGVWSGLSEVRGAAAKAMAAVDAAAQANVNQGSAYLIKAAQANFSGSHRKGEPHQGGPLPNVVTGNLRRSIIAGGIRRDGPGAYRNSVGPTAVYGRRVELGKNGRGAYPYFGPAVAQTRRELAAIAGANWAKYIL